MPLTTLKTAVLARVRRGEEATRVKADAERSARRAWSRTEGRVAVRGGDRRDGLRLKDATGLQRAR
jgi:hypothetical protein